MTAGAGNFLGMVDAGHGVHSFQYTTTEETTLFALPIQTMEDVYSLLDSNSQYRGLLVTSTNLYFKEISGIFAELKKHTLSLKKLLTESYTYYQKTCVEMGHIADHLSALVHQIHRKIPVRSFHRMYCILLNAAVFRKKRKSNFMPEAPMFPRILLPNNVPHWLLYWPAVNPLHRISAVCPGSFSRTKRVCSPCWGIWLTRSGSPARISHL